MRCEAIMAAPSWHLGLLQAPRLRPSHTASWKEGSRAEGRDRECPFTLQGTALGRSSSQVRQAVAGLDRLSKPCGHVLMSVLGTQLHSPTWQETS